MTDILLGFGVGTGKPVSIETTHTVVTGTTNKSGKTTLLEGLASRGVNQKFLVFRSKPEEQVFKEGHFIKPFLQEQSDWRYYKQLLESSEKMKLKFETWHIMQAAKNIESLGGFYQNCVDKAKSTKREFDRQIFEVLAEYAKTLLQELKEIVFTREFPELNIGINIMDLSEIHDEDVQSIIIRSTLDHVLHHVKGVITIIPELWKFSPQGRNNPVKESLEALVRQGAAKKDFVWVDSQDMSGTDKIPLKQCYTWILGLQTEINEAEHTLKQINLPPKTKPKANEITSLSLGQFFLSTPKGSVKFYALPKWLNAANAIKVAKGQMDAESAFAKFGPKDQTEDLTNPVLIQEVKAQKARAEEEAKAREKAEQETENLRKQLEELQRKKEHEVEKENEGQKPTQIITAEVATRNERSASGSLARLAPEQPSPTPQLDSHWNPLDRNILLGKEEESTSQKAHQNPSASNTSLPTINIADEQVDVKINTTFRSENFTTDNAEGKIMYVLCVEFQGKFTNYGDLKTAIREHAGWVMDDSTFTNSKKALRERNMINDDSSHSRLRLPLKLHGLFVDGKQVS